MNRTNSTHQNGPLDQEAKPLSVTQQRLLKRLMALLGHVATTDDESECFEGSAQLMRELCQFIQAAHFITESKSSINYKEQVLEYALDHLNEYLAADKLTGLDN